MRVAGQDLTILIADDNPEHREMWSLYLGYEGYQVEAVADGREVLRLTGEQRIDLLLLDVNMPGMDGFEVLSELRRRLSPDELPIIMATARGETQDIVRGFDLGANDYVTKPLNPNVLMARIKRQLRSFLAPAQPETEDPLVIGEILEDRYQVEGKIGAGGLGSVYRATHLGLGQGVALKLVTTASDESTARLRREGVSVCRLDHPNAVEVLDFFVTSRGMPVLVMELLEGETLDRVIEREGSLKLARCREILVPVCSVLSEAHRQGILHRDIKPQNVFLHRGRGEEKVKVLDFGLAKIDDELRRQKTLTLDGCVIGTPAYMAPERFSDAQPTDASDVYSVGVSLYEMLAGRRPFVGETLRTLIRMQLMDDPEPLDVPGVPRAIERLVFATLAKEPAERPTASEVAQRLAAAR